jgi:hypothetical protein
MMISVAEVDRATLTAFLKALRHWIASLKLVAEGIA